jgi:hypothetical protein
LDEFTTQDTLFALSKSDSVLSDTTCGTRLRAFFFSFRRYLVISSHSLYSIFFCHNLNTFVFSNLRNIRFLALSDRYKKYLHPIQTRSTSNVSLQSESPSSFLLPRSKPSVASRSALLSGDMLTAIIELVTLSHKFRPNR